jgi:hypothetical protein
MLDSKKARKQGKGKGKSKKDTKTIEIDEDDENPLLDKLPLESVIKVERTLYLQ